MIGKYKINGFEWIMLYQRLIVYQQSEKYVIESLVFVFYGTYQKFRKSIRFVLNFNKITQGTHCAIKFRYVPYRK